MLVKVLVIIGVVVEVLVISYGLGLIIYGFLTLRGGIQESLLHEHRRIDVNSIEQKSCNNALHVHKELDYVVGDLLEEFNEFPSRVNGYIWLYKQILKSVLPLAYKTFKSRLASYFGERVR